MFVYEKKLQYPIKITTPNPKLAAIIITQYGGPYTNRLQKTGSGRCILSLFPFYLEMGRIILPQPKLLSCHSLVQLRRHTAQDISGLCIIPQPGINLVALQNQWHPVMTEFYHLETFFARSFLCGVALEKWRVPFSNSAMRFQMVYSDIGSSGLLSFLFTACLYRQRMVYAPVIWFQLILFPIRFWNFSGTPLSPEAITPE